MASDWTELAEGEIAIAHISDLHAGSRSWETPWNLAKQCLLDKVKPALILVTGDLVDTPSADHFTQVHKELDGVAEALGHRFKRGPVPYYVCAGNHDRFRKGNRFNLRMFGGNKTRVVLALVISTLVILVSVFVAWQLLLGLVGIPAPWVIPWVFNRFWSADLVRRGFADTFGGHQIRSDRAELVSLSRSEASTWSVGLFGVDSSFDADASARGWVPLESFQDFPRRTHRADWDLCIFLVHHHVLPVRQLEAKRQNSRSDLFNLTCFVNAGSLLESLANAHVDLVLHGHEHEYNWGSYGSLSSGSANVKVLAAGSVTGNDALKGCAVNDATFNVIILSPDRSGRVRRLKYHANDWKVEDEFPLFSPSEARSSRAHRAKADLKDEILSEISKYVEFTRERDIAVHWIFENWVPAKQFKHQIMNSTGVLDEDDLQVGLLGPAGYVEPEARFEKAGDHRWNIVWSVPETHQGTPLTIEMSYIWRGGGALTKAEINQIQHGPAPGHYREEGFDFATVWTPAPVASAELFLVFPPEYAPERVDVRVRTESEEQCPAEAAELRPRCRPLGVGVYALRVPFPHIRHEYSLIWEPIAGEGQDNDPDFDYSAFSNAARNRGARLLKAFGSAFANGRWWGHTTLSLYLIERSPSPTALRVAFATPGNEDTSTSNKPAERVVLVGDRSAIAQAWWGVATMIPTRPADVEASQLGFIDGEQALVCIPLRFSFDWTNPPPWGIVRIGILGGAGEELLEDSENLWTVLSVATMKMLGLAFSGEAR